MREKDQQVCEVIAGDVLRDVDGAAHAVVHAVVAGGSALYQEKQRQLRKTG